MELIDKAALMARIQSEGKHQASQYANRYDPIVLAYGDCYAMAKTAPLIDAVEVRRGEWIHGCTNGAGTEFCYCSECDEDALKDKSGYTEFSAYCPNCGAKMDGRRESVGT